MENSHKETQNGHKVTQIVYNQAHSGLNEKTPDKMQRYHKDTKFTINENKMNIL